MVKVQCKIHQPNIGCSGRVENLFGEGKFEKVRFRMVTERNEIMLFDDLTRSMGGFQRVSTATE